MITPRNQILMGEEDDRSFEQGVRQAATIAKAAYMLRHNDELAAQLLHDVILAPLGNP